MSITCCKNDMLVHGCSLLLLLLLLSLSLLLKLKLKLFFIGGDRGTFTA